MYFSSKHPQGKIEKPSKSHTVTPNLLVKIILERDSAMKVLSCSCSNSSFNKNIIKKINNQTSWHQKLSKFCTL